MIQPTHTERAFVASRVFTDREDARSTFRNALEEHLPTDAYRVLVWYGVGGQGKSALWREFARMLTRFSAEAANRPTRRLTAWAELDFDVAVNRSIDQAMLALRLQLAKTGRIGFPAFDTAFSRYFALTRPGADMREHHPELFVGESELLDDLLDWSETPLVEVATAATSMLLPGVNILYKYGARLTGMAKQWWDRRGRRVLAGLDDLTADRLLEKLPTYLGADICEARAADPNREIVFLVDTYEALWRERGLREAASTLRTDAWVRLLVQDTPGALFVFFGRDRLRWADADSGWDNIVEQHLLGVLSDADADAFLRAVPIEDEAIRARIVDGAQGLPFYLDLQVDHYEELRAAGSEPEAASFGGSHPSILSRFLDNMGDGEEILLRLASYPAELEESLAYRLAEEFLGGVALLDWRRLSRRSFMTPQPDGSLVMHALMRDALQEKERAERPQVFARVHAFLFDHYDALCAPATPREVTSRHERCLASAQRHLATIDPSRCVDWILERQKVFYDAARWRTLGDVLDATVHLAEETKPRGDPATIALLDRLALLDLHAGRCDEAEARFLSTLDRISDSSDITGLSRACALTGLARVYLETGRHRDAEETFGEALALFEKAGETEHATYATALTNLARVHLAAFRTDEAAALFEKVRALKEKQVGTGHPEYATRLYDLARVHLESGRYDEARRQFETVRSIVEKTLGTHHPSYASALANLALIDLETGRHAAAEQTFEVALAVYGEAFGAEHPSHATTRGYLGRLYCETGRFDEAEATLKKVLEDLERTVGSENPVCLIMLEHLALLYVEAGRIADAQETLRTIDETCRRTLGTDHPSLGRCEYLSGLLYAKTGEDERARRHLERALSILESKLASAHTWIREARKALSDLAADGPVGS